MMFGRNKAKAEIRLVGKTIADLVRYDTRLTLDAQFVVSRWRGCTEEMSCDVPFALFSYYEPTCGKFNPGDAIQTLALRHALERIGETRISAKRLVRDELSLYDGPPVMCVMQGWFSHNHLFWPSPAVKPVFVGTHMTIPAQQFVSRLMEYMPETRRSVEIGCRDLFTLDFCRAAGIKSYFSRCLTLTLPQRASEPADGRVFFVDVPEEYMPAIPEGLRRGAKVISQRSMDSDVGGIGYSPVEQEAIGERMLSLYRNEAKLVVTTAIHVAMPCLAMGIPVVFFEGPPSRDPNRYTSLSGIIPIYTQDQLKSGKVDFCPKRPNIEPLKEAMLDNLRLSVLKARGVAVDESALGDVRQRISSWGRAPKNMV